MEEVDQLAALLVEFDSIVQRTLCFNRHAVQRGDLLSDIWLVWHELSQVPAQSPDLTRAHDRERVIDAWRRRTEAAGRLERTRRGGALSLDHPTGADPDAPALLDQLSADPASDPLVGLSELENALGEAVERLMSRRSVELSWSQPAGYLLLLDEHGGSVSALCAYLAIVQTSLFTRLQRLMDVHGVQSRLFDGRRLRLIDVRAPRARSKPPAPTSGPSPQPGLSLGTGGAG